ncbi:MAG: hypothetical protein ABIF09_08420, partial [Gemmatimonadota bacterium]
PAGSFFIPTGQASSNLISYLFEPVTNDNLVTWGYLDNVVQVTPSPGAERAQQGDMEELMSGMSPEERAQMAARMERQAQQASQGRPIPMYRVMKKTEIPGILVQRLDR